MLLAYHGAINQEAAVLVWPFVVLAATGEDSLTSQLLASKPLHFLGVISYSIYMAHFIVLTMFQIAFGPLGDWSLTTFGLLFGTAALVSIGSHFLLEVPARDMIRGLRMRRPEEMLTEP